MHYQEIARLAVEELKSFRRAVSGAGGGELLLVGGGPRLEADGDGFSEDRLGLSGAQERVGQPNPVGVLPAQAPGFGGVLGRRVGAVVQPEGSHRPASWVTLDGLSLTSVVIHWPDLDEDISVENLLANPAELVAYHSDDSAS